VRHEDQPADQHARAHVEVLPAHRRLQVGGCRADPSAAAVDGLLATGEAFGALTGEIVAGREAGRLGGRHHLLVEQVGRIDRPHLHRAAGAVIGALAAPRVLELAEVRQHVGIGPATRAHLRPLVVVERVPAHREHAVDRARSADHLAARQRHAPPVEMRFWLGPVGPVEPGIGHRLEEGERHLEVKVVVRPAGLEHQHPVRRILAQPRGNHAAGAAGADDDVIETFSHPSTPPALRLRPSGRAQGLPCC